METELLNVKVTREVHRELWQYKLDNQHSTLSEAIAEIIAKVRK